MTTLSLPEYLAGIHDAVGVEGGLAGAHDVDAGAVLTRPLTTPYFRDHWRMTLSELGERVVAQGAAVLARQLNAASGLRDGPGEFL